MELVGELPASHHLASPPARVVGDVGTYGEGRGREVKRCTTDEAPPGLGADSSPPKHFSSHQSRHCGQRSMQRLLSFFPSLSCSAPARPWATVPSSHTPAGRTWCPAF